MSLRIDNEKVLEKYKTIWTKMEELKEHRIKTCSVASKKMLRFLLARKRNRTRFY